MRVIILRHGETAWNSKNLVLGRTDIPLSDKGREQAENVGRKLSIYNISEIYTSPLKRAFETADIICKCQKGECCCIVCQCLIEQNYGIYEGVNRDLSDYQTEKRQYFKRYKNGESYFDVAARVYPFVEYILKQKKENILLVTHGGICRIITNYFQDMGNEEFVAFKLNNCEFKIFEF